MELLGFPIVRRDERMHRILRTIRVYDLKTGLQEEYSVKNGNLSEEWS